MSPRRIALLFFFTGLLFLISACSLGGTNASVGAAATPPTVNCAAEPPTAMDTFRALSPPEGLKFTPLFSEPVKDTDTRIRRLENAVQSVRNDFDTVVPTLVRVAVVEKDIKGLVAQLQTLTDQNRAAPEQKLPTPQNGEHKIPGGDATKDAPAKAVPVRAAPAAPSLPVTPEAVPKGELPPEGAASPSSTQSASAKPASTMPVDLTPHAQEAKPPAAAAETKPIPAPPPPSPAGHISGDAKGIRFADYPDKTRVVVDMNAKTAVTSRLENNGKTLVISMPDLKWLGKTSWDADNAQLISGYHIEGGNLYVDLMYAAQVKAQEILLPGGDVKDYRFVIDLFSVEVHK